MFRQTWKPTKRAAATGQVVIHAEQLSKTHADDNIRTGQFLLPRVHNNRYHSIGIETTFITEIENVFIGGIKPSVFLRCQIETDILEQKIRLSHRTYAIPTPYHTQSVTYRSATEMPILDLLISLSNRVSFG